MESARVQTLSPTAFRRRATALLVDDAGYEIRFRPADGSAELVVDAAEVTRPGVYTLVSRQPGDGGVEVVIGWAEVRDEGPKPAAPAEQQARHWEALVTAGSAQLAAAIARENNLRADLDAARGELARLREGHAAEWKPESIAAAINAGAPLVDRLAAAWERRHGDELFAEFFESIGDLELRDRVLDAFTDWEARRKQRGKS